MVSSLKTLAQNRKLSSLHPLRKVQFLNLQRGKTVLSVGETSVGQEAQRSQREASISRPTSRRELLSPQWRKIHRRKAPRFI